MNWIKKWFTMTPARRITLAYWLGTFQMIIWYGFLQDFKGKEEYIAIVQKHWVDIHWGWWLAAWLLVILFYTRNQHFFAKETLWMTIKNPAKVTREKDDIVNTVSIRPNRPNRPPPPPKPPKPRY